MTGRYGYAPDPGTVTPYPSAPAFFVRAYDTRQSFVVGVSRDPKTGDVLVEGAPLHDPKTGIVAIWGFAQQSSYAEDRAHERSAFSRGWFYGWGFSTLDPTGDYGSFPLAEVVEVTRDEFEKALDGLGRPAR